MSSNSRWKSIQGYEDLARFLQANPGYYVVDTGDRERRFIAKSKHDHFGLSVDGRAVNVLARTGKITIRREPRTRA